uniref:hypothetical protein n=1 Tax=Prevotella sp. TaxID=59823 RepID=UPI0040261E60
MPKDHLFSCVLHKRHKECKEQSSLSPYPFPKGRGSDYFQEIKRKGVASPMKMKNEYPQSSKSVNPMLETRP